MMLLRVEPSNFHQTQLGPLPVNAVPGDGVAGKIQVLPVVAGPKQTLILLQRSGRPLGRDQAGDVPHLEKGVLGIVDDGTHGGEVSLPLALRPQHRSSGMLDGPVQDSGDGRRVLHYTVVYEELLGTTDPKRCPVRGRVRRASGQSGHNEDGNSRQTAVPQRASSVGGHAAQSIPACPEVEAGIGTRNPSHRWKRLGALATDRQACCHGTEVIS